jgi:hypothetical protein
MRRVIKFSADWCQPCKNLSKVIETVETDVPISEIDIDDKPELAQEFGIRGVPTLVMLEENVEVKRKSGSMSKTELEAWLNT